MTDGTPAETTVPILAVNRRRLEHIKKSWDLRGFLDDAEISFLLRMSEGYLQPPRPSPERTSIVKLAAEMAHVACALDVSAEALPFRQINIANEIYAAANRLRSAAVRAANEN